MRTNQFILLIGIFSMLFATNLHAWAQGTRVVEGYVISATDKGPLLGVSVHATGTAVATKTNEQGYFSLQLTLPSVLRFSYLGYTTEELEVKEVGNPLRILLEETFANLDEAVVVGYGAVKRSSLTAAVTKVENKGLDEIPTARPEVALQGKLAGVNISQTRNAPGSAPIIRIRGAGSISAGNDPLIVVDGFPGASFSNINMNDVASIEVLKDASSAAIYGSRAAGGVVIVTTKSGKQGKPVLSVNAFGGFSKAKLHNDWLNVNEYYDAITKYQNREYAWIGGDTSIPVWGDSNRPAGYQVSPAVLNGTDVNWQDAVMETAPFQNYDLAVNGGNDNVNYYISGIVRDQQGTLRNTWYRTYGARASLNIKVNERVDLGLMLNPNYATSRIAPNNMIDYAKYPPFVAIQNPNGTYPTARSYWGAAVTSQANPMAILEGTNYRANTLNTIGNFYASVKLAEGLLIKSTIGTNMAYNITDRFQASWASSSSTSSGSAIDSRTISLINENTINYQKTFGADHDFGALGGASYQHNFSRSMTTLAVNGSFNNDIIQTLNNATINPVGTNTLKSEWGLVSYFGRVNYGFKNKYLFTASIRTDGSSRFGPDRKWGWFPSASAAWRISGERFMENLTVLSDLKLRASFGTTGNMNIGDFAYLGTIGGGIYTVNDQITNWQAQSTYGNSRLGWEKTRELDFGVDVSLFNNRVTINADYYRKRTDGLLYAVSIPGITGFTSSLSNVGEVENKGFEIELSTKNLVGDFKWETSFNVAANRNKVLSLGGVKERITTDGYGMSWLLRVGEPMFSYYGYKQIGVIQSQEQLSSSPVMAGSKLGNPIYEDINQDGLINQQDRAVLGNFMPKATFGMTNSFAYRNFDLSFTIQASIGAKMYNFENQFYQGSVLGAMRKSLIANQWWSADDAGDGLHPAVSLSQLSFNANSDYYIEDASFLAVRNINVGYNFPVSISRKIGANKLRLFASINNAIFLTKGEFHGYNPEGYTAGEIAGIDSKPGYNIGSEPINRVYTFGVNLGF
ncbi:SusC/RagA family TonB-linked outer membrane protein [Olivibacter jilunii]|uniref:SusC/RagA family TonB-linked outer membrane protein n=1 Tax=Olivibacter jilunii TaxID=985016 RepID=UPI00102F5BD5|nr:TonB-dependent receptor [Olivibacter jilunii]